MRTTIIYAPHPDDETLYLGSYITIARARGDRLILVAATNGGSSGAKADGWTSSELEGIRRWEQQSSWRNLTGLDYRSIIRLNAIDSQDPDLRSKITAKALELQAKYEVDSDVEHYAACNNGRAQGVDHDAVALGLRDASLPVARFANRCTDTAGSIYKPVTDQQAEWMRLADTCFEAFGHRSVASYWAALRDSGYTNRIVP